MSRCQMIWSCLLYMLQLLTQHRACLLKTFLHTDFSWYKSLWRLLTFSWICGKDTQVGTGGFGHHRRDLDRPNHLSEESRSLLPLWYLLACFNKAIFGNICPFFPPSTNIPPALLCFGLSGRPALSLSFHPCLLLSFWAPAWLLL